MGAPGGYDQDRGASYLNDITTFASGISSFVQKGANLINAGNTGGRGQPAGGGVNQNVMHALKEKDERAIRAKLQEIDEILTRECLFCGSLLIDMIDNDIEIKEEDAFDVDADLEQEPGSGAGDGQKQGGLLADQVANEWDIE